MPSSVGPNTFGEENLVFGYDLGDVSNSYRGEPTTNLAGTNAARTIGFHNQGAYGNAGSISDAPEKGPGWKKITVNNRGNNSRIAQFPYTSLTAGITYSYSLEVDMGTTSGYYWRIDGSDGYGAITIQNNKVVRTITPSAGVYAIFLNHNTTGVSGISEVIYYRYYQVEQNSHTTQFTEGTRSSTQGLLDLTGTRSIEIANVSFDSNAQMTFDGTDDWLNAPVTLNAGNFTYETVMQANSTDYKILTAGTGNPTAGSTLIQSIVNSSGALINLYNPVGVSGWQSGSYSNLSGYTGVANAIRHIVVVNTANNWKTYVNGVLVGNTNLSIPTVGNAVGIARTGMQVLNPVATTVRVVKIYSRPLTAEEITSNFNAVKTRFNL